MGHGYIDQALVFCQFNGKPLHLHNIGQRDFRAVLKRAKVPHIRLYDLRHCHATQLARQGAPVTVTPRMKNVAHQKLARVDADDPVPDCLAGMVSDKVINWELIAQEYDQMVKYATALKLRTAEAEQVTAPLHPRRLQAPHLPGDRGARPGGQERLHRRVHGI